MLLSWLFRRPAAQPAKPEEAYLAVVARRLLLAPGRRAACLTELRDHLAQRAEATPFQSLVEVESRMGSPQLVATQLNAAAPWWQSRPSGRLYASALGMLLLLLAFECGMLKMISILYPNGDNHGTFVICSYAVFPAATLAMPALVAMLARRWCVRPLQAAVPVCLMLILQTSDAMWTAFWCLRSAFGAHPDSAMDRASIAQVFELKIPVQLLACGEFVAPCALLLSMLGKRALAGWIWPALTLPVVLAGASAWLQYSQIDGMPSKILWVVPLGAALGVGLIAALIRRGAQQPI